MKTFEERYTAWIDDRLEGGALAAFEQELARRAAAADAQADKADAGRLRVLLRDYAQAPALTNGEFFGLQVRERLETERAAANRPAAVPRASWTAWFVWPLPRVAGVCAVCLFVAAALYYGMMPSHPGLAPETMARLQPPTSGDGGTAAELAQTGLKPAGAQPGGRPGDDLMARNDSPAPDPIDDVAPGFAARVPDPASTSATATPLHYRDANVNVLWINGLDYLPAIPSDQPLPSPAAASPPPAADNVHQG